MSILKQHRLFINGIFSCSLLLVVPNAATLLQLNYVTRRRPKLAKFLEIMLITASFITSPSTVPSTKLSFCLLVISTLRWANVPRTRSRTPINQNRLRAPKNVKISVTTPSQPTFKTVGSHVRRDVQKPAKISRACQTPVNRDLSG